MGLGPSTKETTLHHFRDPLLDIVSDDEEIDLAGIVLSGIPDNNEKKRFIAIRTAHSLEAMGVDGAIVSLDSWGNSHIDFAYTLEEIGKINIETVGLTFIGKQGELVVKNDYMDAIVDINKSDAGKETEVVGENNLDELDAKKAVALLKLKMRKRCS